MSKYKPGDIVELTPGNSSESNHYKYAKLEGKMSGWESVGSDAWHTHNEGFYAAGVWESEIKGYATKEEYEKEQLLKSLT